MLSVRRSKRNPLSKVCWVLTLLVLVFNKHLLPQKLSQRRAWPRRDANAQEDTHINGVPSEAPSEERALMSVRYVGTDSDYEST